MPEGSQPPSNIIPAILITLLATLGVVSVPKSPPAAVAQTPNPSSTISPQSETNDTLPEYKHSAYATLNDFLAASPIKQDEERPWLHNDRGLNGTFDAEDSRTHYRVKFLIATVAEPISPPLRSDFDNDLNAIVAGATDAGYTLDSFDIPWLDAAKSTSQGLQFPQEIDVFSGLATGTPRATPTALYSLKTKQEPGRRWERQAGIILFRGIRTDTLNELRLVFLVGENPSRGIIKEAMRDALDQMAWLWTLGKTQYSHFPNLFDEEEGINIVGPRFSGSAPSIRNELEAWLAAIARPKHLSVSFHFFSGAATAVGEKDLVPNQCAGCSFDPLVVSDQERWLLVPASLQNGISNVTQFGRGATQKAFPRIALLAEDTTYGDQGIPSAETNDNVNPIIRLPFPRQIFPS